MLLIAALYESDFKDSLRTLGLSDTTLHILAGVAVYLCAAAILRQPLSSVVPLLAILPAEAFNEWMDSLAFSDWRWPDTRNDVLATFAGALPLYLASVWLAHRSARMELERAPQNAHDRPDSGGSERVPTWLCEETQRGRKPLPGRKAKQTRRCG